MQSFGPMAEWLGSALQKQLQRFESASDLQIKTENPVNIELAGFCFFTEEELGLPYCSDWKTGCELGSENSCKWYNNQCK